MADESTTPEVEPELERAELSWFAEHVELNLTGRGRPESSARSGHEPSAAGSSSDRAAQLECDHWRERAVLWRERALAAELVVKMLQRNLDDLRANLEDLRNDSREAELQAPESAPNRFVSEMSPWRRFVRDVYEKYLL